MELFFCAQEATHQPSASPAGRAAVRPAPYQERTVHIRTQERETTELWHILTEWVSSYLLFQSVCDFLVSVFYSVK